MAELKEQLFEMTGKLDNERELNCRLKKQVDVGNNSTTLQTNQTLSQQAKIKELKVYGKSNAFTASKNKRVKGIWQITHFHCHGNSLNYRHVTKLNTFTEIKIHRILGM